MFYANFVLAKKGPLARVWLAAHWEKKLSKTHVFETDLQSSIESIISPKVKIALRTSGHLLLGVVRIYSRKAKYLLADCTEALIKIKMAFRPDVVDLPIDNQKAAASAITLPEFQEWDAMVNNMGKFDITVTLQNNQCRVEEITMKEDLFSSRYLSNDNFFGDVPFGETSDGEIMRDEVTMDHTLNNLTADVSKTHLEEDETGLKDKSSLSLNQSNLELALNDPMMEDVGFGAGEGLDFLEDFGEVNGLDEDLDKVAPIEDLDETLKDKEKEKEREDQEAADRSVAEAVAELTGEKETVVDPEPVLDEDDVDNEAIVPEQPTETATTGMETTLFYTEAVALEPVEVTVGKEKRKKRKRKLVVDNEKIIQRDQMKKQIESYDDLVKAAVVAPPTRWRMSALDVTAKMLFDRPISFKSKKARLEELYKAHQTTKIPEDLIIPSSQEDEEVQLEDPTEILREADENSTNLPELTVENTEIQETILPEEQDEERFEPPIDDIPPPMDIDMENPDQENDITVPPPFQLDVTEKTINETVNESSAKETEDEEPEAEKTDQQDKRWTKRTQQTLNLLEKTLKKKSAPVNFKDLTKKCNRKQATHRFYTLLTLSKEKCITVEQDGLFADILIHPGERFNSYS